MANQKKTWFLVPGWDIPPSAIKLGSIIADPTAPQKAIITPESLQSQVSVSDPAPAREPAPSCSGTTSQYDSAIRADVNTTVVTDYSMNTKDGRSSIVGIFAEFLQVFGLGGASIQFSKERVQSYAFEKMETTWFLPPLAFAQEALADQKVQGFLQMVGTRRPLYIISGVKTVWGADVSTKVEKSAGWDFRVGVDATGLAVPISVGPEVSNERKRAEETGWRCEGPLVFAFQLQKIRIRQGGIDIKAHVKGTLFDLRSGKKEDGYEVELGPVDPAEYFEVVPDLDETTDEDCMIGIPLEEDI